MPPAADRWAQLADDVLAAVVAGYVSAGVSLPERQFVSVGPPAWDCELLAVQIERQFAYSGNLASETIEPNDAMPGWALRGVVAAVHLIRCVPTLDENGNPPSADAESDAAALVLTDSQRLVNVLVAAVRDGDIGGCQSVAFQEWVPQLPSGGLGGGLLRMRFGT